jgi:hypothetical protein
MTKVSLRIYNREIEGMIEAGQLVEAIAHCQHILKTFPMHVETYLLLGKTYLEARRYSDAADIFQRTLMTVPDNFVSHVGMSIIRDDEGKLDEAIWHMERAFEVQPSNPAIQGELRRLYGRRDGVEPPKIRLSRDALANMYAQGELFNQAIAEIRAVLAEDENRADLQVMLARAYYRGGRKVEAVEMAATLLKKYTYCMDALRILVDVLPGTTRSDDTQVYKQRLTMLDPYSFFATGSVFASDKVADSAVNLERMEYAPGAAPLENQPGWASSLGIHLSDDKPAQLRPESKRPTFISQPAQPAATAPDISPQGSIPGADNQSVPDWMRSAGWQESDDASKEEPMMMASGPALEPAEEADIPDWLKAMAPKEVPDDVPTGSEPSSEDLPSTPPVEESTPDWMAGLKEAGSNVAAEPELQPGSDQGNPPASPSIEAEIPDWLAGLKPTVVKGTVEPEQAVVDERENLPASLSSDKEMPDWLSAMKPDSASESPKPEPASIIEQDNPPASPSSENEIPDWLMGLNPSASNAANAQPPSSSTGSVDAMPDWLAGEGGKGEAVSAAGVNQDSGLQPEKASPAEFIPEDRSGMQSPVAADVAPLGSVSPEPSVEIPPKPVAPKPAPDADKPFQPTGSARPLNINDDDMAWLENLAAKQGAKEEELFTHSQGRMDSMPDLANQDDQPPMETMDKAVPADLDLPPLHVDAEPESEDVGVTSSLPSLEIPSEEPSTDDSGVTSSLPSLDFPSAVQRSIPTEESQVPQAPAGADDNLPEWLKSLTGGKTPEPEEFLPEVFGESTGSADTPPAWLETPPAPAQSPQKPVQSTPRETPVPSPVQPLPPEPSGPTQEDDLTITSWLSKLDVEDAVRKARSKPGPTQPTGTSPESLPEWLKDLEKTAPQEDASEALPGSPASQADLPEWLRAPVNPPSQGAVTPPSPGDMPLDQEIPSWIDEVAPVTKPPAPTMPEEWIPAAEGSVSRAELDAEFQIDSPEETLSAPETVSTPEPIPTPLVADTPEPTLARVPEQAPAAPVTPAAPAAPPPTPVTAPAPSPLPSQKPVPTGLPKGTGMLSHVPELDRDADVLKTAQKELLSNNLNEAMKTYSSLIKKGRLLDEVVHDLREALYRFPVDIIVWQTLGDASMRANRLQDALDAYTKAEELLR